MSREGSCLDDSAIPSTMLGNQKMWLNAPAFKAYGPPDTSHVSHPPSTSSSAPYVFPSPMLYPITPLRGLNKRPYSFLRDDSSLASPEPFNCHDYFSAAISRQETLHADMSDMSTNSIKRHKLSGSRENLPFSSTTHSGTSNLMRYDSPNSSQTEFRPSFLSAHSTQAASSDYSDSICQNVASCVNPSASHESNLLSLETRRASYASTLPEDDHSSDQAVRRYFSDLPRQQSDCSQVSPPSTRLNYDRDMNSFSVWPLTNPPKVVNGRNNTRSDTHEEFRVSTRHEPSAGVGSPFEVPILSLYVTTSLNEALMIIGFLRQKSLRCDPASKDRNIWSAETLFAFDEAIRTIPRLGRAKLLALTPEGKRPFGRNELIADYIYRRTGIERDRKQVSSHIQVLKNSKKVQPHLSELLRPASDGESIAFNDCTSSWYGACITGDFLTLHACTPEFPFPSQVLMHLPAFKNDHDYHSFLQNAHQVRRSAPNRRLEYDSMTSEITRNPDVRAMALEEDSSIINLTCNEVFRRELEYSSASDKDRHAALAPYDYFTPSDGQFPGRVLRSRVRDVSSARTLGSSFLPVGLPCSKPQTPNPSLNLLVKNNNDTCETTPSRAENVSWNPFLPASDFEDNEVSSKVVFLPLSTMSADRSTIADSLPRPNFSTSMSLSSLQMPQSLQHPRTTTYPLSPSPGNHDCATDSLISSAWRPPSTPQSVVPQEAFLKQSSFTPISSFPGLIDFAPRISNTSSMQSHYINN